MNKKILNKKLLTFILFCLLLFAGIIALTQESDETFPAVRIPDEQAVSAEEPDSHITHEEQRQPADEGNLPDWIKPARWFRSNTGGMAIEEIPSMYAALRNEYALVIDFAGIDEIPAFLIPYYDNSFYIETRRLYENEQIKRVQWIFRDINGVARLICANADLKDDDTAEPDNSFIEIFDENAYLLTEYNFFENDEKFRTDYHYTNGHKTRAEYFAWQEIPEENEYETGIEVFPETEAEPELDTEIVIPAEKEYQKIYTDYFYYNRSLYLRAVERVFLTSEPMRITFPYNLLDAARFDFFMDEKLNPYPEFFGDVFVSGNNRMIFATDERGRILTQSLIDNNNNIIWEIKNVWSDERIISISKTEGESVFLSEYEYDEDGNRLVERNFRNGILERLVTTEGNTDTEEIYFNNIAVLRAVWEDGRKISETRLTGSRRNN